MSGRLRWAGWLVSLLLSAAGCRVAWGQMTVVDEVVKRADGTAAQGTVLISWPTFPSATGTTVLKGSTAALPLQQKGMS